MPTALDRARAGDQAAFAALTDGYRRELRLHCYRMLGSVTDAEDLLQETMTAAWQGLERFSGSSSLRAWLYRIATNRCLNAIRDTKRRLPLAPIPPFEPPPSRRGAVTWLQPYPDAWLDQVADQSPGPAQRHEARESIELRSLRPCRGSRLGITATALRASRQTAVVVLCDVLDFSTVEVAAMLRTSATAVKGLLQRARRSLDRQRPAGRHAAPDPGSATERHLAQRFADAFVGDETDAIVALLSDDAWLPCRPRSTSTTEPRRIAGFLRTSATWRDRREVLIVPARANMQPAFASYLAEPGHPDGRPTGLLVLTLSGERICGITRFLDPDLPRLLRLA